MEGVGDHEIYRPPEAGAQVRILPGAPRVTCIVSVTNKLWHGSVG
jgi:hypothetical protein